MDTKKEQEDETIAILIAEATLKDANNVNKAISNLKGTIHTIGFIDPEMNRVYKRALQILENKIIKDMLEGEFDEDEQEKT